MRGMRGIGVKNQGIWVGMRNAGNAGDMGNWVGMRGKGVKMWGIEVRMQGIRVGMREIKVGMQGIWVVMWGIQHGDAGNRTEIEKRNQSLQNPIFFRLKLKKKK